MIMTALVLMASASLFTVNAADKNKNKGKKVTVMAPGPQLKLNNAADSLSYAAGMGATRGLIPFIQQSYQVDTAYMADFIEGYEQAMGQNYNGKLTARAAGALIAKMADERIYPGMKKELSSTGDSISEAVFHRGFLASLRNDTTRFTLESADKYRTNALTQKGEQWMASNAKKPGVKVTKSGLQYKVLTEGHGDIPKSDDEVEVIYEGRLVDGTVFDATSKHNGAKTDKFKAGRLIKGWTEALTMMPVGSKWEVYIPQELAYGSRGAGQIPPYSPLVFTLELVDIVKPQPAETAKEETKTTTSTTGKKATGKATAKKRSSKK